MSEEIERSEVEAALSARHELGTEYDEAFVERLRRLVVRAGLPAVAPVLDPARNAERYLELMRVDKKAEAGEIRFVLIDPPGRASMRPASDAVVAGVIARSCQPA